MPGESDGRGEWEDMDELRRKTARKHSDVSCSSLDEEGRNEGKGVRRLKVGESDGFKLILRFKEGHDIRVVSPVVLTRGLKEKVGEIVMAKVLGDGALLIKCRDEAQREKAMKLTKVCNRKVEMAKKIGGEAFVRGVIWGIPVEEKLEVVKENLKGGKIIGIKRLQARREGVLVDSLSVLLDFQEKVLPEKVSIGYMRYNVRAYVPPPLRCYKCQKYGHIAAGCKGKQKCGRCGGDHEYGKCEEGAAMKCVNCGGAHSVAYGGCEVRKSAVEVQKMRVNRNISYAEAVKVVQRESRVERKDQEIPAKAQPSEQIVTKSMMKDILLVNKEKFVYFMADVINCVSQARGRSERIEIIVKRAARYLNIVGISGEDVQEELERQDQLRKEPCSQN